MGMCKVKNKEVDPLYCIKYCSERNNVIDNSGGKKCHEVNLFCRKDELSKAKQLNPDAKYI